jgi:hypothetical protein
LRENLSTNMASFLFTVDGVVITSIGL